jgi:hypothetical protein
MESSMLSRVGAVAAFSLLAMPAIAASLPCPDGITATFQGGAIREYNGADPSDPQICLSTIQNRAGGTETGFVRITERRLFGFFRLEAGMDADPARGPLQRLLSGDADQVEFTYHLHTGGAGFIGLVPMHDTWKRVGTETLTIDGAPTPARVVEMDRQRMDGYRYHIRGQIWLDATRLLYLKGRFTLISGEGRLTNYTVRSITPTAQAER